MTKNLLTDLLYEGDDGKPIVSDRDGSERPVLVNDRGDRWEFPTFETVDNRTAEDFKALYASENVYRVEEQRLRLEAQSEVNDLRVKAWEVEDLLRDAEDAGYLTVAISAVRAIYMAES